MIQVVEQGDIFGKIGRNFGEGVGKAIPEAVNRKIFSDDINKIRESGLEGHDLAFALSNVRGGTQEQKQTLFPIIMDESRASAALRNKPTDQGSRVLGTPPTRGTEQLTEDVTQIDQPVAQPVVAESEQIRVTPKKEEIVLEEDVFGTDPVSLVSSDLEETLREGPPVVTPEEINRRAAELYQNRRGEFRNYDHALARAEQEAATESSQYERTRQKVAEQRNQQDDIKKKFSDKLQLITQKSGTSVFADLSGEQILYAENQILRDVKDGKKPDTAIGEWTRYSKDFASAKSQIKDFPKRATFGRGTKENLKELKTFEKNYKRFGAQRELANDLQTYVGIGPFSANTIAFPASDNLTESLKSIDSHPVRKFFAPDTRNYAKLNSEEKENVKNSIGPKDSIQSVQLELSDKGINEIDFIEYLRDQRDSGELNFNERQLDELRTTDQVEFSLSELLNNSIASLILNFKTPVGEQVQRFMGKR